MVDELHIYRGVFGSHVTNVFRRLKRVCPLLRAGPHLHLLFRDGGEPQGARGGPHRERSRPHRRERRAAVGQDLHPLQPAHRQQGAGHTPVVPDPCPQHDERPRRQQDTDYRLHHEQALRGGAHQVPQGHVQPEDPRQRPLRDGLPRRLPAEPEAPDRKGPARADRHGGGQHERPGAGHRHRRPGGLHHGGLPRLDRERLAAGGQGGPQGRAEPGGPDRPEQPHGPVHRGEPGLLLHPLSGSTAG